MTNIRLSVPDSAESGEIIEVKAMIQHPMESGYRRGARGEVIERNILTRFECHYAGKLAFAADYFPAVSANPFITFHLRASKTGLIEFKWTDQFGKSWSDSAEITVSE